MVCSSHLVFCLFVFSLFTFFSNLHAQEEAQTMTQIKSHVLPQLSQPGVPVPSVCKIKKNIIKLVKKVFSHTSEFFLIGW